MGFCMFWSLPALGMSTVCRNPSRERALAAASIKLPRDDIHALERRMEKVGKGIRMETWGTALSDRFGRIERQTLGLQSRKVSVSIRAKWQPGHKAADVQIWRTCINDDLEPWRGYWRGFVQALRRAGYTVVPAQV